MFYCDIGDGFVELVRLDIFSSCGYVNCCNSYVLVSLGFVDGYSFFFECFEWDEILCVYVGFVCNALYGVIFSVGMLLLNISSFTYVILESIGTHTLVPLL